MPDSFNPDDHATRKLRIATISGLVFGTFVRRYAARSRTIIGPDVSAALRA